VFRWRCFDSVDSSAARDSPAVLPELASDYPVDSGVNDIDIVSILPEVEKKSVPVYGPVCGPCMSIVSVSQPSGGESTKLKVLKSPSGNLAWVTPHVKKAKSAEGILSKSAEIMPARATPLPWWLISQSDKQMLVQVGTCAAAAVLDPLLAMVDTVCIGQLGVLHLAAMAPNNTVFGMVNQLATFTVVVAVTNKLASALGAGKSAESKRIMSANCAFNVGMASAITVGFGAMAVFLICPDFFLNNFGAFPETLAMAKEYFWVRSLGLPIMLVSMVLQGSYSAALDLKTPLVAICVSGVMNAVLDCLFIFQFQWGLFGAALATVIAQYVGGGMLVYQALTRDRHKFGLPPLKDVKRYWAFSLEPRQKASSYKEFLGMCMVQSTRAFNVILTWTMCNIMASRLGTVEAASHQLLFQYQMFLICAVQSFTTVANSVVARTFYAGGMRSARNLTNRLSCFSTLFAVGISTTTWGIRYVLPMLFTSDVAVHACAQSAMLPMCLMLMSSWFKVPEGALLGVGDGAYLALCYVPATVIAMLQLANSHVNGLGLAGVWYALCFYYLTLMTCFCLRWYRREWTELPAKYFANWRDQPWPSVPDLAKST